MKHSHYPENWHDIDSGLYERSVMLLRAVKNLLSVKFLLHADAPALQGDIFLFNHFSRFETFIPQFLLYEKTGVYSCAIASGEFFKEDNVLSNYLKQVGVFPHDHPHLFALLAGQILRGRKIIIFPEGGMVKDRRVIDKQGEYSIYSRMTGNRRKQHTGAAVLGQGVEVLKAAIRKAFQQNHLSQLQQWKQVLQFATLDELMSNALKPTLIVPGNITFYPIRATENLLFKSVELFAEKLSLRQAEELLIEGNIMLKDTDMDIRLGAPVNPCCDWGWREQLLVNQTVEHIQGLDDVYRFKSTPRNWQERWLGHFFYKNAQCSRDQYMHIIYANVTVNLSHLASTLIMSLVSNTRQCVAKKRFFAVLYIAIKYLQQLPEIHLHRSLLNPNSYSDLLLGRNQGLENFISYAKDLNLINEDGDCYHFSPKLFADYDFDRIRLENPIAVYNNEVAPLSKINSTLLQADYDYLHLTPEQLTHWYFEDEQLSFAYEQHVYLTEENAEVNQHETASADAMPFLIHPTHPTGIGILLIHGLLASPAELRDYGEYLAKQGFTVLGIRLRGHGTSPYALRDLSYEQWYSSVRRGLFILETHCTKLFVIGFSTGGALALKLAAENHASIIGIVPVSVPMKFVNPAFMLIPILHSTNKVVHWMSSFEGVKPFLSNEPEHPQINYQHVAVRALYELRRLIEHVEDILPNIDTPTLLLFGDADPVVSPQSIAPIFDKLGSINKRLHTIAADRHGILMENIGGTWSIIDHFLHPYQDHAETPSLLQTSIQETVS